MSLQVLLDGSQQVSEVHGRYFEDMRARVLVQILPNSQAEWLGCIPQDPHKKVPLQPFPDSHWPVTLNFQEIFSRTLPNVISSSSILHDDVGGTAVLQFTDNLATRRAWISDQDH